MQIKNAYGFTRVNQHLYQIDKKELHTSAVTIGPAEEVSFGRRVWEIRIQHPVDHEWGICVRCVFGADDERPQQICSVFVSANDDRF